MWTSLKLSFWRASRPASGHAAAGTAGIRANLAQFAARSRNAFADDGEALHRVQQALGIRALERRDA
jgi:hypothetical protein